MTSFAIFRIIGNSLPPRHALGENLRAVEHILKDEQVFSGCRRNWVVNRLVDPQEKATITGLIASAGEPVVDIPFDARRHYDAFLDVTGLPMAGRACGDVDTAGKDKPLELEWMLRHKSQCLININHARNRALELGRASADWTLVLDGGVVFSNEGWEDFVSGVERNPEARFALLGLRRSADWSAIEPVGELNDREEPQIAFHRQTSELFDERLRYGNRNKVDLLKRLGVEGPWQTWRSANWDRIDPLPAPNRNKFISAGFLMRLPSGESQLDSLVAHVPDETPIRFKRFVGRFVGVAQRSANIDLNIARQRRRHHKEFVIPLPPLPGEDRSLETVANSLLGLPPRFVTDKLILPPSGDKHDYYSRAPYWSDAGERFDGVPQDTRSVDDPASGYFDKVSLRRATRAIYGLSLSGKLMGRKDMFAAAADLLSRWLLDPATRMNPHASYAQVIPGRTKVNHIGLLEFWSLSLLPYAITLLGSEGALTATQIAGLRQWYVQFLRSCEANGSMAKGLLQTNNVGTWVSLLFAAAGLFAGEFDRSFTIIRNASLRLGRQLGPFSIQPLEVERTRPLHYSLFNLCAWWSLSRVGAEFGIQLREFKGRDDESLTNALLFCADNRTRFADYAGNAEGFDRWITLLCRIYGLDASGGPVIIVDEEDLGLPPLVVLEHGERAGVV